MAPGQFRTKKWELSLQTVVSGAGQRRRQEKGQKQRKNQAGMAVIPGIAMPGCQIGVKKMYSLKAFLCPIPGKIPKRIIQEAGTEGIRQA